MIVIVCALLLSINSQGFTQQSPSQDNDIESIFDGFFRDLVQMDPEMASQLGIPNDLGINISYDELTDVSDQAISKKYELYKEYQAKLVAYNQEKLNSSQRLSREILLWHIKDVINGEEYRYHEYLINPVFGFHNSLTTLMTEYHRLESYQDVINYLLRLEKYPRKFDQILQGLKIRKERSIIPPDFIIEKSINIMSDFITGAPEENTLYFSFKEKLNTIDGLTQYDKQKFTEKVSYNIQNYVYPSYQRILDYLEDLKALATDKAGVWKLPEGDSYYQFCLHFHTTTDLTADEIHDVGVDEVERIQQEASDILIALGFLERDSFGLMMNQYWRFISRKNGIDFYYPNTRNAKKRVLKDYQKIIKNVQDCLPDLFGKIPKTPIVVEPVAKFKEVTLGAYYEPASIDGKRGGIFYVNLVNLPFKPRMKSLTYHEAIPGHHFQIALQQESQNYKLFRNLIHFTGFMEGWALYAEKLGMENDWFDDLYSKLACLGYELLRAVRLVVDTGIHHKHWSREEAYQYMVENLGWGSERELDRYVVWPGQACAYKIGELKILALKELAQEELNSKFDIREFHRVVLENGSLPLSILERHVRDWIALIKN